MHIFHEKEKEKTQKMAIETNNGVNRLRWEWAKGIKNRVK